MKLGAALAAFVSCAVISLITAPAPVGFGLAVAGAISWCRYLDREETGPAEAGPQCFR